MPFFRKTPADLVIVLSILFAEPLHAQPPGAMKYELAKLCGASADHHVDKAELANELINNFGLGSIFYRNPVNAPTGAYASLPPGARMFLAPDFCDQMGCTKEEASKWQTLKNDVNAPADAANSILAGDPDNFRVQIHPKPGENNSAFLNPDSKATLACTKPAPVAQPESGSNIPTLLYRRCYKRWRPL